MEKDTKEKQNKNTTKERSHNVVSREMGDIKRGHKPTITWGVDSNVELPEATDIFNDNFKFFVYNRRAKIS